MIIFEIYLGRQFHATQELEYHEIDDPHIQIGQTIQQIVMLEPTMILKISPSSKITIHAHLFSPFTRNLAVSFMMKKTHVQSYR